MQQIPIRCVPVGATKPVGGSFKNVKTKAICLYCLLLVLFFVRSFFLIIVSCLSSSFLFAFLSIFLCVSSFFLSVFLSFSLQYFSLLSLCICMSRSLSIYPSSFYLFVCLPVYLTPTYLSSCPSICPSILSIYVSNFSIQQAYLSLLSLSRHSSREVDSLHTLSHVFRHAFIPSSSYLCAGFPFT